jgi:hypothetical protein
MIFSNLVFLQNDVNMDAHWAIDYLEAVGYCDHARYMKEVM